MYSFISKHLATLETSDLQGILHSSRERRSGVELQTLGTDFRRYWWSSCVHARSLARGRIPAHRSWVASWCRAHRPHSALETCPRIARQVPAAIEPGVPEYSLAALQWTRRVDNIQVGDLVWYWTPHFYAQIDGGLWSRLWRLGENCHGENRAWRVRPSHCQVVRSARRQRLFHGCCASFLFIFTFTAGGAYLRAGPRGAASIARLMSFRASNDAGGVGIGARPREGAARGAGGTRAEHSFSLQLSNNSDIRSHCSCLPVIFLFISVI